MGPAAAARGENARATRSRNSSQTATTRHRPAWVQSKVALAAHDRPCRVQCEVALAAPVWIGLAPRELYSLLERINFVPRIGSPVPESRFTSGRIFLHLGPEDLRPQQTSATMKLTFADGRKGSRCRSPDFLG